MKKNRKNATRIFIISLWALFATLMMAGCLNPLDSPAGPGTGLTVHITGSGPALTLYPAVAFTKYVLNFTCTSDGSQTYGPKTITGTSGVVYDDIPNGTWSITAKGFVIIGGTEYEAAEGS